MMLNNVYPVWMGDTSVYENPLSNKNLYNYWITLIKVIVDIYKKMKNIFQLYFFT